MPKNTSAGFVIQNQSWEKSENLFYWTACYLIEKYNTARWVIGSIATQEMCALGARLSVYVSVQSTFAQLSQNLKPDFLQVLQLAFHMWYRCPPTSCSLQPAEHQKTQSDAV